MGWKMRLSKYIMACIVFLLVIAPLHQGKTIHQLQPKSVDDIRSILSQEFKWIMYGSQRTIYLSTLSGDKKTVLFDNAGEESYEIIALVSTYDGKKILFSMHSEFYQDYALWVIDLDQSLQTKILDSLFRPVNLGIANNGEFIVYNFHQQSTGTYYHHLASSSTTHLGSQTNSIGISPDSTKLIYVEGGLSYNLIVHDLATNSKTKIEGHYWNPIMMHNNRHILVVSPSGTTPHYALWKIDYLSGRKSLVVRMDNFNLWLGRESRFNDVLAFSTAVDYYSMIDNKIIKLNREPFRNTLMSIGISNYGKYILFGSHPDDVFLAESEGLFAVELKKIFGEDHYIGASWYNHPPFPPFVTAEKQEAGNHLSWEQSQRGSFYVRSYRIYRSTFPQKDYIFLDEIAYASQREYHDLTIDPQTSYYYLVRAIDEMGTTSLPSNEVLVDRTPPEISITSPLPDSWHTGEMVAIMGRAIDHETGISAVRVGEIMANLNEEGYFEIETLLTQEGGNLIEAVATDLAGNTSNATITLKRDTLPPEMEIDFPDDQMELYALETSTRGSVVDEGIGMGTLSINDIEIEVQADGSFIFPIDILEGENTFVFKAEDLLGNTTVKTITVYGVEKIVIKLTIGSEIVLVNEIEMMIDAPPFIHEESGRTLVPARFVIEPIGGQIAFDASERKVTILRDEIKIELWIGNSKALVNGEEVPIDSNPELTPIIVESRTFLPLRFITETIGFKVDWNPLTYQIRLEYPHPERMVTKP